MFFFFSVCNVSLPVKATLGIVGHIYYHGVKIELGLVLSSEGSFWVHTCKQAAFQWTSSLVPCPHPGASNSLIHDCSVTNHVFTSPHAACPPSRLGGSQCEP